MEEQAICWKYNESSSKHSQSDFYRITSELSASQTSKFLQTLLQKGKPFKLRLHLRKEPVADLPSCPIFDLLVGNLETNKFFPEPNMF